MNSRIFWRIALTALLGIHVVGCSSSSHKGPVPAESDDTDDEDTKARYSVDTPEMELIQDATAAYDRGLLSLSRDAWVALRDGHPGSAFLPLAELKIADTYYYGGSYPEAITSYEEFIRLHPGHAAVPYARFQIGNAYFAQYSDMKRDQAPLVSAIKAYNQLINDNPRCDYAALARRQVTHSRELLAQYEVGVAQFYLDQGLVDSSANRLRTLVEKYGDTAAARNEARELYNTLSDKLDDRDKDLPNTSELEKLNDQTPTPPELLGGYKSDSGSDFFTPARTPLARAALKDAPTAP